MSGESKNRTRAVLSFSSGKDSLWALHVARLQYEVVGLLTTITEPFNRVAMHGVRRELLNKQADALGLPLTTVSLPYPCSNREYEQRMESALAAVQQGGVDSIVFGDLFLEDIRVYREQQMRALGMEPLFPLWGLPTAALAADMVVAGVEAVITCVDPKKLSARFAGRPFDEKFLAELPVGVDPCGENGEFHTVVTAGPGFESSIPTVVGEVVQRDGFVFADVKLAR